jgi:hypothetical protein
MLNSAISRMNAMKVTSAANEELRTMRTVPARWYAAPQSPNNRAMPDRPAAIGCRMRVNVRLCIVPEDSWPVVIGKRYPI